MHFESETQERLEYLLKKYRLVNGDTIKARTGNERETKGWPSNNGYKSIMVKGKVVSFHRAVFALHNGRWPHAYIDHINSVRDDNHIDNLRECSQGENLHNKRGKKKYHVCGCTGKFRSAITKDGKTYNSRRFYSKEEAIAWYDLKADILYGDFAT